VLLAVRTRIVEPVGNVSALEGRQVTLGCIVNSDPHYTVSRRWYRNSAPINVQSSTTHAIIDVDGSLVLQSVSAADAGLYTCTVDSDGGKDNSSGWLHIIGWSKSRSSLRIYRPTVWPETLCFQAVRQSVCLFVCSFVHPD